MRCTGKTYPISQTTDVEINDDLVIINTEDKTLYDEKFMS